MKIMRGLPKLFFIVSCTVSLATVFIINNRLVNGEISGKYYWFYGSIVLVCISVLISVFANKRSSNFSLTDGFVSFFACSVFITSLLFNAGFAHSTKLMLFVLLLVLYISVRYSLQHEASVISLFFHYPYRFGRGNMGHVATLRF
jgi:hypothetical protein